MGLELSSKISGPNLPYTNAKQKTKGYRGMMRLLQQLWSYIQAFITFIMKCFGRGNSIYFENSRISVNLDTGDVGGSDSKAGSLGEGAFSTVYRATDATDRSRQYAVKKMFIQSPESERSLTQEIDSFQRFRHPHVLKLTDSLIQNKDGLKIAYLLFPLCKRGSLRDELNRTTLVGSGARQQGAFGLLGTLSSFSGIVSAFNVLHTHAPPYVHQDIKPENILFTEDGRPLLCDFGSVRLADISITNRAQALAVADEAATFCTVSFRAPELFDPPRGGKLDTRTDVWAIGCLLFAWWFGYSPFECEFTENVTHGGCGVRVTDCSHSRVLSRMPRPSRPTPEDSVILDFAEWVLVKDHRIRVYTSDVESRLQEVLLEVAQRGLQKGSSLV